MGGLVQLGSGQDLKLGRKSVAALNGVDDMRQCHVQVSNQRSGFHPLANLSPSTNCSQNELIGVLLVDTRRERHPSGCEQLKHIVVQ